MRTPGWSPHPLESPAAQPFPQNNLSYMELNTGRDGSVMSREQIEKERQRMGFCLNCPGVPVRLFEIKKHRFSPLRPQKNELTEPGKSLNGQCLACYPELDPNYKKKKKNRRKKDPTMDMRRRTTIPSNDRNQARIPTMETGMETQRRISGNSGQNDGNYGSNPSHGIRNIHYQQSTQQEIQQSTPTNRGQYNPRYQRATQSEIDQPTPPNRGQSLTSIGPSRIYPPPSHYPHNHIHSNPSSRDYDRHHIHHPGPHYYLFENFKSSCIDKSLTLEAMRSFIDTCGEDALFRNDESGRNDFPLIQYLLKAKPSFEITNYLFHSGIIQRIEENDLLEQFILYKNQLLQDEVNAASKAGGSVPIRQGRITFVGQGRAGKTSTIRSLRQERHDDACMSTIGIDVDKVNVSDLGINLSSNFVSADGIGAWRKSKGKVGEQNRAIGAQLLRNGKLNVGDDVGKMDLLEKYSFGKYLNDDQNDLSLLSGDTRSNVINMNTLKIEENESNRERKIINSNSLYPSLDLVLGTDFPTKHESTEQGSSELKVPIQIDSTLHAEDEKDTDKIQRCKNFDVDDIDGNEIRLSIWDYGGQVVFRSIQHFYMVRNNCYVIVIDLTDFLGCRKRKESALENLRFWYQSIEVHATSADKSNDPLAMHFPPVVLVGTHFDEIKKCPEHNEDLLQIINHMLLEELSRTEMISKNRKDAQRNREYLYNLEQDLCFWPVNNRDPKDMNICKLRHILVHAIANDPRDYLNDLVPISWLECMDQLGNISNEEPIIPLYSENKETRSIVSIMHTCQALQDIDDNTKDYDSNCKRRAVAFLQFCHQIGIFVYFDEIPGLQHLCLLKPQWVLDTMSYVIRDFKLHRFRRDHRAMEVNEGKSWSTLLEKGILDLPLLRKLWLGEDENFSFMVHLMIKIGIFAPLPAEDRKTVTFLVPSLVTTPFSVGSFSNTRITKHLDRSSLEKCCIKHFKFENNFLPTGYYIRVVNSLVSGWNKGYRDASPELMPNACLMYMGKKEFPFVLVLNINSNSIDVLTKSEELSVHILPHVKRALDDINKEIYSGNLRFDSPLTDTSNAFNATSDQYRDEHVNWRDFLSSQPSALSNEENITSLLQKYCEVNEKKASKLAKLMIDADPDLGIAELTALFEEETEEDLCELLQEDFGVSKKSDQKAIIRVLKASSSEGNITLLLQKYGKVNEKKASRLAKLMIDADPDLDIAELNALFEEETEEGFCKLLQEDFGLSRKSDQKVIIRVLKARPKEQEKEHYLTAFFGGKKVHCIEKERGIISRLLAPAGLSANVSLIDTIDLLCKATTKSKVLHLAMHGVASKSISQGSTLAFKDTFGSYVEGDELAEAISHDCICENKASNSEGSIECVFLNACNSYEIAKILNDKYGVQWIVAWDTVINDEAARNFAEAFYHYLGSSKANSRNFRKAYDLAMRALKLRGWAIMDPKDKKSLLNLQQKKNNILLKAAGNPRLLQATECCKEEINETEEQQGETPEMVENEEIGNTAAHPSMQALSYNQLLEIRWLAKRKYGRNYRKVTMRDVNKDIIIPQCEKEDKSFASIKNPNGLKTEVFVSHSWDEPFGEFIDSIIEAFAPHFKKPTFWICAFALKQGDLASIQIQVGTTLEGSFFVKALQSASTYLVVRNRNRDIFTRMWCICELMYAKKFGFIPDKTLVVGPDSFSRAKTSCLDATAFDQNDRERILRELLNNYDRSEIDNFINDFRSFPSINNKETSSDRLK